jgi:hypothetical protein
MKRAAWWAGGLALLIALPSLGNGFVYDDVPAIVGNPLVHAISDAPRIWTSPYWALGLLYRPLTIQVFAIEWWLGGGSPLGFHLVNVLLYALTTVLVVRVAWQIIPGVGALAAGLVFAVHPVHVEAVANGVGQSELLAALFILIGVNRYLAWRSTPDGFTLARRLGLVGCYLLAIASKETGYVLPALLLGVEVLQRDALPRGSRLGRVGPVLGLLAAVAVAGLLFRVILFGGLAGEVPQVPLRGLGTFERAVAMLAVVPHWVRLLVWPARLQAHYGPPELPVTSTLNGDHGLGLTILLATVIALVWGARRARPLALGLAWIAIALLPVSNLPMATGVLLAERTLFLPSVGLALLIGWGFWSLTGRLTSPVVRRAFAGAGIVVLVLAAWRSVERARIWKDQDGFFAALERDAPDSYRAQLVAGIYHKGQGRYPDAERTMRRAWQLDRNDPAVFEEYGQLLRVKGRCDLALPILQEGVSLHPEATLARARLIECSLATGDTTAARAVAREAVALGQPEFTATLRRLSP